MKIGTKDEDEFVCTIPVCFATANDCECTCVAITSVMMNGAKDTFIRFIVLVPSDFCENSRQLVLKATDLYENCSVEFVDMKGAFDDAYRRYEHINIMTYYRLKLPSILVECDKCLYLDSDIIVCGDLREIYDVDMGDNYIAGVKAPWYILQKNAAEYFAEDGLASTDSYINAGVLLMNLSAMRCDGIEQRFTELSNRKFDSQDQDIINIVCYDGIIHLPYRFNTMTKFLYANEKEYKGVFAPDEVKAARENALVIHYADKVKPWQNISMPLAEHWWAALISSNIFGEYCESNRDVICQHIMKNKNIAVLERRCRNSESELRRIKKSLSYRFGRGITWFPRQIFKVVKSVRDTGVLFTLKRIFRRLSTQPQVEG